MASSSSPKIAVYSTSDLKNTTDDALPNYLNSLKFQQNHILTDIRLGLGYSAVIISAITFYFDYQLGWDQTKAYTFWAVIAYFILNSALTVWIWGVEKGKVYNGTSGDVMLSIASSVKKHSPLYKLKVRCVDPKEGLKEFEVEAPFTKWFTHDGHFIAQPFQQWLAGSIPQVGKAAATKAGGRSEDSAAVSTGSDRGIEGAKRKGVKT